jgi:hypothetical protein
MTSTFPSNPAAEKPWSGIPSPDQGSKRYLVMFALVVDNPDPNSALNLAAAQSIIRTTPARLEGNRYEIDRDCAIRMSAEMLKASLLRALYPRETA